MFYFLIVSIAFSVYKQDFTAKWLSKLEQLWMQKFQCLLFVLKRLYICYYGICMAVPLTKRCGKCISSCYSRLWNPILNIFKKMISKRIIFDQLLKKCAIVNLLQIFAALGI